MYIDVCTCIYTLYAAVYLLHTTVYAVHTQHTAFFFIVHSLSSYLLSHTEATDGGSLTIASPRASLFNRVHRFIDRKSSESSGRGRSS